jgi:sulfate transport system ATP-binding protein
MSILVSNVSKHFGQFAALNNVTLEIPEGDLVALLGPSGCGKTTLLRIIAGLETADEGRIIFNGLDKTNQHVSDRGIGFVFQHYALFRHMTVFDNVAFGLRVKPRKLRPSEAEISKKVKSLLDLVQLGWLADRFPDQLSGGQRQRIALARALAVEPNVLLLDEPFGALDASVRKDLRQWLRSLHQELHVTSIFVTHDQEEAMEVASQVVVLNQGQIEQQGAPSDIYDHPKNAFVSKFIGQTNIIQVQQSEHDWLSKTGLEGELGSIAHIRPQHISVTKTDSQSSPVIIRDWQHLGAIIRIELFNPLLNNHSTLHAEMTSEQFKELNLSKGDHVNVNISHANWF